MFGGESRFRRVPLEVCSRPTRSAPLDPPFIPISPVKIQVYADSVPLGGVLSDPVTHEIDDAGAYVFQPGRISSDADTVVRTFFGGGRRLGRPARSGIPSGCAADVRDEYVSFEGAERDYGVVVRGDLRHPEELTVDRGATAALRAAWRARPGGCVGAATLRMSCHRRGGAGAPAHLVDIAQQQPGEPRLAG